VHADVLIVTVTKAESQAVTTVFQKATGQKPKNVLIGNKLYLDLGTVRGASVYMMRSQMGAGGPGAAQEAIAKGIGALSPSAVIMAGIAFGINENEQKIGDVLVSERLTLYDKEWIRTGPAGQQTIISMGTRVTASPWLIERCHFADEDARNSELKVRFGLILSGEKLVDNLEFRRRVCEQEPDAIGGEMEGGGLYTACQGAKKDWILVKGICDWADGNKEEKREERQQQAAKNAATFVLRVLELAPLKNTEPEDRGGEAEFDQNDFKSPRFLGQTLREQLLEHIEIKADGHPILAIEGLPGAGKTFAVSEFAHRCCARGKYQRVYWYTCRQNETLDELFIELRQAFQLTGTLEAQCKSLASHLRRKRLALIIDDFHEVEPLSYGPLIDAAARSGSPAVLILGSRTFVDAERHWPVIEHLEITGFSEAELQAFLESRNVMVDSTILARLHLKTDGLPLAASLFTTLVGTFNENPSELLTGEMQRDRRLQRWFKELGAHITGDERSLLQALSVYEGPFNRKLVRFLGDHFGIASVNTAFESLQKQYLVQKNALYYWKVHHLIASFSSAELQPAARNVLRLNFAQHCLEGILLGTAHVFSEQEAIRIIRAARFYQRAKAFIESGKLLDRLSATIKTRGLYNLFIPAAEAQIRGHKDPDSWIDYHLAHCYQITGHLKLAFELAEKLASASGLTQPNKRLAFVRLYAELLASERQYDTALQTIREAMSQTVAAAVNPTTYSQAKTVEILILTEMGRLAEATELSNHLFADSNKRGDRRGAGVARVRLGIIEAQKGNLSAAMGYFDRAVMNFTQSGDIRGEAWARVNQGEVLLRLGHREQGARTLCEGMKLKNQMGECSTDYLELLLRLDKTYPMEAFTPQIRKELSRVKRTLNAPRRSIV
jgi:nucleoside phosphorylase/tetratricopeptide (TPR) repeat protein